MGYALALDLNTELLLPGQNIVIGNPLKLSLDFVG